MEIQDAVERAIEECIREGVLKEFLEEHRSGATEMSIFEYNQERHMMQEREAAWNEGHAAGEKEGRAAGEKIGRETGLQEGLRHTALNLKKIASVYKGQHAPNRVIPVIFCVILNRRTSSTPLSSALKITGIPAVGVFES